jgi:hypothetical protein
MNSTFEQARAHRASTLATLSDEHPVWCTLMDVLTEAREAATLAAIQEDMADSQRAWQCGYLAAVTDVRDELKRLRGEGQQADG